MNGVSEKGSFYYLLSQYGVQSKPNIAAGAVASPVNGNEYDITLSPLFLVRGGWIYPGQSTPFQTAGSNGRYWSSRAGSGASYAYSLYFSTSVYPSSDSNRYHGYSLRCLIPTPQVI